MLQSNWQRPPLSDLPNAELLKAVLAAFGTGDRAALSLLIADDVVWHTPGRNLLSGERSGRDEVLAHLGRVVELTDGTYRTELLDVLASDRRAAAFYRATGRRAGRTLDVRVLLLCEFRAQQIAEAFATPVDQHAFDRFFTGGE